MNYDEIFEQYNLDKNKLMDYGFNIEENNYIYKQDIDDSLYVKFIINDNLFYTKVYESIDNEEYLPYTIKINEGAYISKIREEIETIKQDILSKCFESSNIRQDILNYVYDKYRTIPEYPWEDSPLYCTLKTNNKKKWYGLIMNIPYKTLGIKHEGNIDAINLKNDSDKIIKLIDNRHYFKAYHMNKKYWYTILLDNNIDIEQIKDLIDESYRAVENK